MALRELDHRSADRLDVTLVWDDVNDRVGVLVNDRRDDIDFIVVPPRGRERDAFMHPFAYERSVPRVPLHF